MAKVPGYRYLRSLSAINTTNIIRRSRRTIHSKLRHGYYHLQGAMLGRCLERFVGVVNIVKYETCTMMSNNQGKEFNQTHCERPKN